MNKEYLLTSSNNESSWSACLWDYKTGNNPQHYKNGGAIAPKTLSIIGQDYIIGSDNNKPVIHAWALNSQEPRKKSTWICPGLVKALTVCPQNTFLAAAVENKVYLWHITSGKLFNLIRKNYQNVLCVKFSSCGSFLCIGGEEGLLLTYKLVDLVNLNANYLSGHEGVEPIYSKNDHSLAITDLHIGIFSKRSRIVTTSMDSTAKIYDLFTGELLLNLITAHTPTALIMDKNCWKLFLGYENGKIQEVNFRDPPRTLDHHLNEENIYHGHDGKITCLDINLFGNILASGSEDFVVFIWDIFSKQILRKLPHKETITNIKFVLGYENFFVHNHKPKIALSKTLDKDLGSEEEFIATISQDFDLDLSDCEEEKTIDDDLQTENLKLKSINKQLYDVALGISRKYNFG